MIAGTSLCGVRVRCRCQVSLILLSGFLLSAYPCAGQSDEDQPAAEQDLVRYHYDAWSGGYFTLGEVRYEYGGVQRTEPIVDVLSRYESSARHAAEYRRLVAPGRSLRLAGLAVTLAGASILAYDPFFTENQNVVLEIAGLVSTVLGLTAVQFGIVYRGRAEEALMDAVWSYNQETLRRRSAPGPGR